MLSKLIQEKLSKTMTASSSSSSESSADTDNESASPSSTKKFHIVLITDHARRPSDDLLEQVQLLETSQEFRTSATGATMIPKTSERTATSTSCFDDSASMTCIMDESSISCFLMESSTSSFEVEYLHGSSSSSTASSTSGSGSSSSLIQTSNAESRWQHSPQGMYQRQQVRDQLMRHPRRLAPSPQKVTLKKKPGFTTSLAAPKKERRPKRQFQSDATVTVSSMGKHMLMPSSVTTTSSSLLPMSPKMTMPKFLTTRVTSSSSPKGRCTTRGIHEILDEALLRVHSSPSTPYSRSTSV